MTATGAAEAVLPAVASGTLKLWLKADSGVVTNAGKVTQWNDQSPSAANAEQGDPNLQPLFINGAVPASGKPAIRFDGLISATTGDYLQGGGDLGLSGDYTSFLVYS
ncbi:MAG: hypothetical protein ABIQ35_10280, partial [Verrucomicrobiota bacterium]